MPVFVIHKHHSRNLHYDLRLEFNGVLHSWAVPKKPPEQKGIKRLAVFTGERNLNVASFEGEIPEGSYGAGKIEIWDKGRYKLKEKTRDKIVFELKGKKLKAEYALVRFRKADAGKQENWLLMMHGKKE